MATAARLISVDFEVFGTVQGVFFRKYTRDTARKYDLVGWVKNTDEKTVRGTVQGPEDKVKKMKKWLSMEGSPKSTIKRYEFKNETPIDKTSFSDFTIVSVAKKKKKSAGTQSSKKQTATKKS